jgi:cell division protein FtsN
MAASRAPARSASRSRPGLGTLLALLGLLAVLAVTFTAGALAGRLSLRPASSSAHSAERTAKAAAAPPPELTFYRELTAPLAQRPVPAKPTARPGKREALPADALRTAEPATDSERRAETPKPLDAPKPVDPPKADGPKPDGPKSETPKPRDAAKPAEPPKAADGFATNGAPRGDAGRYTIQVGAYNGRAQAEALKARLAAEGHDAYVAEAAANGVMRYKVRIGAFPSAEDARKAAASLATRSQVATYITTR